MNRDEARLFASRMVTGCHKDATQNHYNDVQIVINAIYDDFESRTCENCKHLSNGYCKPHQRKIHSTPITMSQKLWISSAGCNKFERREDE